MEDITNVVSSSVGVVVQSGAIYGDLHLTGAPPIQHVVARQLPPSTRHFVEREAEIAFLTGLVDDRRPGTATICALDGAPGIGKTALMVHWGHRVKDRFPDGQIYVDLHGFDRRRPPVDPADAAHMVLVALQGPASAVPAELDARSALLRSLLAGRRILLLIDNARDSAQVLPLLPGSAECFTLVTSRDRLDGLVIRHGAHQRRLPLLTAAESRRLIAGYVGPDRADDRASMDGLVRRCAGLPMALSIVAAKAAVEPTRPLRSLLRDLDAANAALDALRLADASEADVRVAVSLSYNALPAKTAWMFRTLARHPGPDLDVRAAAALTGLSLEAARNGLEDLVRRNLLAPTGGGRFAFHDLIREYGLEKARRDRHTIALGSLLNHYLHLAHRADRLINSHRRDIPVPPCARPELVPPLHDGDDAMGVFAAEYDNFLAATRLAQRENWRGYAWQLPWTLSNYAYLTARWSDWAETHEAAVRAARQAGETVVEARLRQSLGRAYNEMGAYDDACREYNAALRLHGDEKSQANALNGLGGVYVRLGRHARTAECAARALALYEHVGDRAGQASTLNLLGRAALGAGAPDRAVDHHRRALRLFDALGDDYGRAHSGSALATALAGLGRLEEAVEHFSAAFRLHRAVGNRYYEAEACERLAGALLLSRRVTEARTHLRHAAKLLEDIGDRRAAVVRERLNALGHPSPDGS
ncbi:hypothetical protein Aple_037240 [Acrocarpospora pleiomorpha]|uniref:Uncharacterized protein n=1 Tax=Acrocarpospora pleiomorpha TaxID=90975 RepID=A0A5M3XR52_9ACTN|nr:tetratricopeptide repeat protein [Acrocarpospora pleiomorpha]GES20828.1 hypothetical protein Aple_037240 [Acrocarpospora pleiomorpha]